MPNTFLIECAPEGEMLSPDEIHEKIWEVVSKEMGKPSQRSSAKEKGKMVF
jgi:hypothetical protein